MGLRLLGSLELFVLCPPVQVVQLGSVHNALGMALVTGHGERLEAWEKREGNPVWKLL